MQRIKDIILNAEKLSSIAKKSTNAKLDMHLQKCLTLGCKSTALVDFQFFDKLILFVFTNLTLS